MKKRYVALMDLAYLACIWLAGTAIALMSVIIPWGVFTRYVLGTGSQWPEPIAILLMMVFTFLGAATAYRANGHIAVTLLTEVLPPPARHLADLLADLLMMVVCAFVVAYGTRLSLGTMGQTISELPWLPVGLTYAWLPLGGLITLLFVIERRWIGPQHERRLMRYEQDHGETSQGSEGLR
ncbi:MAG: TRAP transporter small permease [Betaproteobacteria bacterium]|nr:TRAP transporter small permease [Betaproteobacteria bacterium]